MFYVEIKKIELGICIIVYVYTLSIANIWPCRFFYICSNSGSFLQNCYLFFFVINGFSQFIKNDCLSHLKNIILLLMSALFLFKKKCSWNHIFTGLEERESNRIFLSVIRICYFIICSVQPFQPICQLFLKVAIFITASMANSADNAPWRKTMKVR